VSLELVYTSAPRGLKPGSHGFCTVACTRGMSAGLMQQLESLSGYRQVYPPQDPQARFNPVAYSHLMLTVMGRRCHVLSRIADAGLDYTNRTNKFAHHVVLDAAEVPPGGPACLLANTGLMRRQWPGDPCMMPAGPPTPRDVVSPRPCQAWQRLAGDAGWGGVLAETMAGQGGRQATLIFPPGADTLPLLAESIALLPVDLRWRVTFSTYFTKLPPGIACQWRCVLDGTPEAAAARKGAAGTLLLDLCRPLGSAGTSPFTALARSGQGSWPAAAPAPSNAAPSAPREARQPRLPAATIEALPPVALGPEYALPPPATESSLRPPRYRRFRAKKRIPSWMYWASALAVVLLILAIAGLFVWFGGVGARPLAIAPPPQNATDKPSERPKELARTSEKDKDALVAVAKAVDAPAIQVDVKKESTSAVPPKPDKVTTVAKQAKPVGESNTPAETAVPAETPGTTTHAKPPKATPAAQPSKQPRGENSGASGSAAKRDAPPKAGTKPSNAEPAAETAKDGGTPTKSATTSADPSPTVKPDASPRKAANATAPPPDASNPFAGLPEAFAIKRFGRDNMARQALGRIPPDKLDLKLINGMPSGDRFSISKNGSNGWTISSAQGSAVPVAQISVTPEALWFQWTDDGCRNPNRLRNCLLQIRAHGNPKSIPLRKPFELQPFVLDKPVDSRLIPNADIAPKIDICVDVQLFPGLKKHATKKSTGIRLSFGRLNYTLDVSNDQESGDVTCKLKYDKALIYSLWTHKEEWEAVNSKTAKNLEETCNGKITSLSKRINALPPKDPKRVDLTATQNEWTTRRSDLAEVAEAFGKLHSLELHFSLYILVDSNRVDLATTAPPTAKNRVDTAPRGH
jgi:hypothetical protein